MISQLFINTPSQTFCCFNKTYLFNSNYIHVNGFLITKIAQIQHVYRAEIPLLHYFFNLSPIFCYTLNILTLRYKLKHKSQQAVPSEKLLHKNKHIGRIMMMNDSSFEFSPICVYTSSKMAEYLDLNYFRLF